MTALRLAVILVIVGVTAMGCKKGSGSTEEPELDASVDAAAPDASTDASVSVDSGSDAMACEGTICGADCVDLDSDDRHCGSCGIFCDETQTCLQGSCTPNPE